MDGKRWLVIGALLALCSVAFGAFGAHGLKTTLGSGSLDAAQQAKLLHDWDVGAQYQMYHALALIAVGLLAGRQASRWLPAAGTLFCIGVFVFSGGLYAYVLTGTKLWAMIVPIGGVSFLAGWLTLAIGVALRDPRR